MHRRRECWLRACARCLHPIRCLEYRGERGRKPSPYRPQNVRARHRVGPKSTDTMLGQLFRLRFPISRHSSRSRKGPCRSKQNGSRRPEFADSSIFQSFGVSVARSDFNASRSTESSSAVALRRSKRYPQPASHRPESKAKLAWAFPGLDEQWFAAAALSEISPMSRPRKLPNDHWNLPMCPLSEVTLQAPQPVVCRILHPPRNRSWIRMRAIPVPSNRALSVRFIILRCDSDQSFLLMSRRRVAHSSAEGRRRF